MENQNQQQEQPQTGFAAGFNNAMQSPVFNQLAVDEIQENCIYKATASIIAGGGLGFLFGAFFSGFGTSTDRGVDVKLPLGRQVLEGFKESGRAGWGMAKTFAAVGALFSASECYLEQSRGKVDAWNSVGAGCFSGAVLAGRQGPQAIALGCLSFAGFSYGIDYLIGRHGSEENRLRHDEVRFEADAQHLADGITTESLIEIKEETGKSWIPWLNKKPEEKPQNPRLKEETGKETLPEFEEPKPQKDIRKDL